MKLHRHFTLVAVLSANLIPIFPTTCARGALQDTLKWDRYFSKDEEFSVLLPEVPSLAFKSRPTKPTDARHVGRIYGAYSDGIVYLVLSENNPQHAEKLDIFISEFEEALPYTRTKKSAFTFDRELILDGFMGKRYRLAFYNGIEGVVDFYSANKHVYTVFAAGGNETNPLVQYFLHSFSLGENVSRKEIMGMAKPTTVVAQTAINSNQSSGQVFSSKEVARPAFVVSRPEPFYTEAARFNQVVGKVVLTAVLSSSGKVTDIKVIRGLKEGLTEGAVDTARKIKFIPALKDRKLVSQHIQLEYYFNLY